MSGPGRQPRNLEGLLRLAVENTSTNDAVVPTQSMAMNPERRRWLQEALSSMTINVTDIMKESMTTLLQGGDRDDEVTNQEHAFDQISEWVENQDVANDFEKIGGFEILPVYLKCQHSSLRQRSAELVALLVQNNSYCQTAAISRNLLPILLELADTDEQPAVRAKAMFAVSAMVRDNPAAEQHFTKCDGFSVLLRAMQTQDHRLKTKAAFLMTALCRQQPAFKDTLCDMGFVEQLSALIQTDHDGTHEHILAALLGLATGHNRTIQECQRPELNLKTLLQARIQLLHGKDEYQEEETYCQSLLDQCFNNSLQDDTVAR